MLTNLTLISCLLLQLALGAEALDGNCAPGGNFDLSIWKVQLPSGTPGKPDTISSDKLQGCGGHQDQFFLTDQNTGELVMRVPGGPSSSGCVSTSGSEHCRTEFRETTSSGADASWDSAAATNQLAVTMTVTAADDGTHGTVIGQVFGADAGKPVVEMFYNQKGDIVAGVERTPAGGSEAITTLGNVPVGTQFSYVLAFENGELSATINDKKTSLDTFTWGTPKCFFKVGDYNQGTVPSEVRISAIDVKH